MLPDPSTIPPLDPEEFVAPHQYAGMIAENEFVEKTPRFTHSKIRMQKGTFRFRKHPGILFGFAVGCYFRDELKKVGNIALLSTKIDQPHSRGSV